MFGSRMAGQDFLSFVATSVAPTAASVTDPVASAMLSKHFERAKAHSAAVVDRARSAFRNRVRFNFHSLLLAASRPSLP